MTTETFVVEFSILLGFFFGLFVKISFYPVLEEEVAGKGLHFSLIFFFLKQKNNN